MPPKKAAQEESKEKTEKKDKPKKGKKMLVLLLILFVLAGSSAGAYYYFKKPAGEAPPVKKKTRAAEMESLEMGDMVVNLAGNGGSHYLKVKITIEYPKDKKLAEELKKKKYIISDVLITALRNKTLSEVASASSADKLKNDLLKEINSRLEHGEVTGIYFTDFLVQ